MRETMSIEPNEFTSHPDWQDLPIVERLERELTSRKDIASGVDVVVGEHPEYGYVMILKDGETGCAFAEKG
jgi:hypothetical protein